MLGHKSWNGIIQQFTYLGAWFKKDILEKKNPSLPSYPLKKATALECFASLQLHGNFPKGRAFLVFDLLQFFTICAVKPKVQSCYWGEWKS